MGKKRKELTQEEIWDDTGLIESWNQSYEEYERYYSIHARGERVEDALEAAEEENLDELYHTTLTSSKDGNEVSGQDATHPASDDTVDTTQPARHRQDQAMANKLETSNGTQSQAKTVDTNPISESMPNAAIVHSSGNPALKDLMMSWYWAGYYTGLYEGQRQAASKAVGLSAQSKENEMLHIHKCKD